MAELAEHAWWIPEIEDLEHVKMSELKAATRHISLNSGYLIFCEDPADLEVGDGFEIWPISAGPVERLNMWPEGAAIEAPPPDAG